MRREITRDGLEDALALSIAAVAPVAAWTLAHACGADAGTADVVAVAAAALVAFACAVDVLLPIGRGNLSLAAGGLRRASAALRAEDGWLARLALALACVAVVGWMVDRLS